VRCGASVGVSLYPDHARDPAELLASADAAMYRVKNAG
jgi:GGDEF domain-containing protein